MRCDRFTRAQYRAMFQLWISRENSDDPRSKRRIVAVRLQPRTNYAWIEIEFMPHEKPFDTGSNYRSYWIYIDRLGYAYNDNPSDYERFERCNVHRAKIEEYSLIWSLDSD